MKLYDLFKDKDVLDLDTGDNVFDTIITVHLVDDNEISDNYDKFINFICHNVDVIDAENNICDWSGFIEKHYNDLMEFSYAYWIDIAHNKDGFVYQWINEIALYLAGYAGYADENTYTQLLETLNSNSKSWHKKRHNKFLRQMTKRSKKK